MLAPGAAKIASAQPSKSKLLRSLPVGLVCHQYENHIQVRHYMQQRDVLARPCNLGSNFLQPVHSLIFSGLMHQQLLHNSLHIAHSILIAK
jgi:hypothetical protein